MRAHLDYVSTVPFFTCRCQHGTLKIDNGLLTISRGFMFGNAWEVPFRAITRILIGIGAYPDVTFQAPGGGFTTKLPAKKARELLELHSQVMMQQYQR
jgi:hypothetical protein